MRHYLPLFIIYAIYTVFNYITTIKHGEALYFTADWVNTPGLAIEWVVCIFFITLMSFAFSYYITKAKLRKYNRYTQKKNKQLLLAGNLPDEDTTSSGEEANTAYLLFN